MRSLPFLFATILLTIGFVLSGKAQDSISTFPFHLDSRLLVFEGKMNGVPTNFAFDTGAAMGMANSLSESKGRLDVKGKKIRLLDSNQQIQKVKTGLSEEFEIGGFRIEKVRSLVNDMNFLFCMDYFLLGQDVIKQLNWEIDFENKLIRVSKSPFPVDPSWTKLPIFYKGNRPFVTLAFEGQTFPDALVDFGYVQVMDFPDHLPQIQNFLSKKDSLGLSNPNISTAMGALGQKTFSSRSIWVDSLLIGGSLIARVPIDFEESSYPKLGLGFFNSLSQKTILNHSDMAYYLEMRPQAAFEESTHIGILYQDGKLVLTAKPEGMTEHDSKIAVGEEIKSINGFSAADFEGECSYFSWSNGQLSKPVEIEKLDGTKLFFPKVPLK